MNASVRTVVMSLVMEITLLSMHTIPHRDTGTKQIAGATVLEISSGRTRIYCGATTDVAPCGSTSADAWQPASVTPTTANSKAVTIFNMGSPCPDGHKYSCTIGPAWAKHE